jgi:CRP-like cAMP-binding protein
MAILHMTIRSASVRCVAPLDVLSLPREEFGVLAAHLPDLRQRFSALAAERQAVRA